MSNSVEVRQDDGATRIILNRPEVGNAIDLDMSLAFSDAVSRALAQADPIIILESTGRLFCAGGDVRAVAAAPNPSAYIAKLARVIHEPLKKLAISDAIVIAAVQGPAAGAGFSLVLNADIVVASERASFVAAYSSLGLTPDCGLSWLLPEVIGPRRAAEVALTGRSVNAATAVDWGIVNIVVPEAELAKHTSQLAATLTAGARGALGRTRGLLRSRSHWYADHLDREATAIAQHMAGDEARQRLETFTRGRNA